MTIKILESNSIKDLKLQANKFIGHKKIIQMQFTTTAKAGKFFDMNTLYLLVESDARRGTGRRE